MKAKRGQYGLLALGLSSYVLQIPNDACILFSENLIGCSTLRQEYCKLMHVRLHFKLWERNFDHNQALLHSECLKWKTKDWGTHWQGPPRCLVFRKWKWFEPKISLRHVKVLKLLLLLSNKYKHHLILTLCFLVSYTPQALYIQCTFLVHQSAHLNLSVPSRLVFVQILTACWDMESCKRVQYQMILV